MKSDDNVLVSLGCLRDWTFRNEVQLILMGYEPPCCSAGEGSCVSNGACKDCTMICRMIVPPQHNLRINFHGFLVLCILLIVQKVVMGLTPAV
ncbi:hypothetical protein AHAS_Ahas17G0240200 [Arachis hypogaea]